MKKSAVLGKVTPESYKDFLSAIEEAIKQLEGIGLQELNELRPDVEPAWKAYKFMNGMGALYGAALVRAYTADLQADDPQLPSKVDDVIDHLGMIYNDVEARRTMKDDTVIRMAAEELPQYVPSWLDLDEVIRDARASYEGKGVYFNDFYYSVLQAVNDIMRAFRMFVLHDHRRESMVFRKEGAGGEYIPSALLALSEEEERKLLKTVVREANKKIDERGFYGIRQEPLPSTGDFTILYWANGPGVWFVDNRTSSAMIARDNGRESIKLDANMILVPFHPVFVEKVVGALEDLPLYTYSTEAKERGEYPEPTSKNVQKATRAIIEAQHPGLDREELALRASELFSLLVLARRHNVPAITRVRKILESQPVNIMPFVRLIMQWMGT